LGSSVPQRHIGWVSKTSEGLHSRSFHGWVFRLGFKKSIILAPEIVPGIDVPCRCMFSVFYAAVFYSMPPTASYLLARTLMLIR